MWKNIFFKNRHFLDTPWFDRDESWWEYVLAVALSYEISL